MTVSRLAYTGYRNLKDGAFEPCGQVNVLFGKNAQGKTNLLEALWLFTGARSFRGAKDSELVTFGSPNGSLLMDYSAAGREQTIKLTLNGSRSAEQNGIPLDSPIRLTGNFCAVIFSPEHLGLVKDSAQQRRRFIDSAICQIRPPHASLVLEYRKTLNQRNALLKDIPGFADLLDTLDVWDERLCNIGAQLTFMRLRYLHRLSEKASGVYEGISKGSEQFRLSYTDFEDKTYDCDVSDAKTALKTIYNSLKKSMIRLRSNDIDSGYTHAGPHRDDIRIDIAGISARTYGSQGQQRSAVLSLKLAEAMVLHDTIGEPPVLLLDDVMSELDSTRQDYLLNHIGGMQVFITCCDPSWQSADENSAVFEVHEGMIDRRK